MDEVTDRNVDWSHAAFYAGFNVARWARGLPPRGVCERLRGIRTSIPGIVTALPPYTAPAPPA